MHTTERQQRIKAAESTIMSQRAVAETATDPSTRLAAEAEVRKFEAVLKALNEGCDYSRYAELLAVEAYRFSA